MKLALARAMLMNADIMLLDEPTNHLDVTNVQWLINYLVSLKGVSARWCPWRRWSPCVWQQQPAWAASPRSPQHSSSPTKGLLPH